MSRFFMTSHEWAEQIDDNTVRVGLSRFAADEIGEVIHIDLPETGTAISKGEAVAEVESVKSVNDCYAPVSGTIKTVNDAILEQPELLNSDAEGDAWFYEVTVDGPDAIADLLDAAAYAAHTQG